MNVKKLLFLLMNICLMIAIANYEINDFLGATTCASNPCTNNYFVKKPKD